MDLQINSRVTTRREQAKVGSARYGTIKNAGTTMFTFRTSDGKDRARGIVTGSYVTSETANSITVKSEYATGFEAELEEDGFSSGTDFTVRERGV